ncbi:MAG: NADPH-dependent glutamate synthase [Clostridiales bacterium]|nr:NADPH-dependent glutamate synthase [Clostridiales bacterium]
MADMRPTRHPMPEQEPLLRNQNFDEVALGYTAEIAQAEAARCLNCKNAPCMQGCPVQVHIPAFIGKIAEGAFGEAFSEIVQTNALPAVCGRVCPQESQCEAHCVRGIRGEPVAIGRLERFAADWHAANCPSDGAQEAPAGNGRRVAVVGSGPAGLTCAGDLARKGYDVTVFEAFHKAGGVLVYGIPEFRLPKSIVAQEIERLERSGVKIVTNAVIGRAVSIDELFEDGFEAVFIGSGAGLPRFLGIPGENLLGVYSANEYLTRVNLMKAYRDDYDTPVKRHRRVAVIGGGNVAMDAARCAKRLGAEEVTIVYRRSRQELPARAEEVHHAEEEQIAFRFLSNPVAVHGDEAGHVCALACARMELGEPDASGRRAPVAVEGENFLLEVDAVIDAIGTTPNPLLRMTTQGLSANAKGCLIVDDSNETTRAGVFAGGDAVTGSATVILAMGAGKRAAAAIEAYLQRA